MKDILRVLVPVDFSEESELAVEWAVRTVRNRSGATVYLLHALPLKEAPGQLGMGSVGYQMETEALQQKLKKWQERLPADVLSFTLLEPGRVAEVIARVCEKNPIDLVIMTTRGRRGMQRILEGSTTEEAIRLAPCPVLVLHLNQRTTTPAGLIR
jgi:nucleotide-binding universal stress UspA family protein